jgi:hypothetical protein
MQGSLPLVAEPRFDRVPGDDGGWLFRPMRRLPEAAIRRLRERQVEILDGRSHATNLAMGAWHIQSALGEML